jgi:hypothetical protein
MVRAIRQQPKPDYLSNLGKALQRLGRHEEALKSFDKAAQLKPDDAESWKNIGNVLVDLGRPAEALLSFQHVLELDPRHWEAALRSASLLRDLGRFEEAKHYNDHNRSARLQTFLRLLDVDATFVSLQKEPRPGDQAVLCDRTDIVDLTAHLTDFAETAALVSCLDLVITVDTSVAHPAAALGCPTWILLPYTPDYRWLLDRDDSPWYPTVRLFRQTETREYAGAPLHRG